MFDYDYIKYKLLPSGAENAVIELDNFIRDVIASADDPDNMSEEDVQEASRFFRNVFGSLEYIQECLDYLDEDLHWKELLETSEAHPL